jgi:hypothetical protein
MASQLPRTKQDEGGERMFTDTRDARDLPVSSMSEAPGLSEEELAAEGVLELPDRPMMCGYGYGYGWYSPSYDCCCYGDYGYDDW